MIGFFSGGLLALLLSFACFIHALRIRALGSRRATEMSLYSTFAWLLLVLGLAMMKVALLEYID